jgi:hypothetical protein
VSERTQIYHRLANMIVHHRKVSAMRDWWSNDVNRLEKIARDGSNLADIEEVLVEKMEDEWREVGQQYTWYNSSVSFSFRRNDDNMLTNFWIAQASGRYIYNTTKPSN